MGATVLMAGVVLLVVGGAGLFAGGSAAHSRMRTARPAAFVGMALVGVLLVASGAALLAG